MFKILHKLFSSKISMSEASKKIEVVLRDFDNGIINETQMIEQIQSISRQHDTMLYSLARLLID